MPVKRLIELTITRYRPNLHIKSTNIRNKAAI